MENEIQHYSEAIHALKSAILKSRYKVATLANKELLSLYFGIGQFISDNTGKGFWGKGALEQISNRLVQELPGLKGFSSSNLKRMRIFFEEWKNLFQFRPLLTDELQIAINQLYVSNKSEFEELSEQKINYFFLVSFTHHSEIIAKAKSIEERFYYIEKAATEYWTVDSLRTHLKNNSFLKDKIHLPNNFDKTISNSDFRSKAMQSFKDEYLLDFVNIEDPDDVDEREIENEIIRNIKKFIMALGSDFSFIGNQFRLIIDNEEFFIDLLFFNRKLKSLVEIDIKKGKFKAEYLGKMNLYLSLLDENIKQIHENPSIGIILCKEKNNKIVEFSFRDFMKPMGVSTYITSVELPNEYKNILPDADSLKNLM